MHPLATRVPAWTHRLIHPSVTGTDRIRAQVGVLVAIGSSVAMPVLGLALSPTAARPDAVLLCLCFLAVQAFSVAVTWRTGNVNVSANLQFGATGVALLALCAPMGGVAFPVAPALLVIPPLAELLVGRSAARGWTLGAVVALILLTALPGDAVEATSASAAYGPATFEGRLLFFFSLLGTLLITWFVHDLQAEIVQGQVATIEAMVEDLRVARDTADAASRAKSNFLATISHEIRTPLNGILGTAEGMLMGAVSREQREQLSLLHRSGHHLLDLVNDILDLARIESGQFQISPKPVELRRELDETVAMYRHAATERGLSLDLRVDRKLPAWVAVDPMRLRQVVANLVGNAVKFTDHGAVQVRVSVDPETPVADEQVAVHLTVSDTGIGIAADDIPRLFQKFSQADGSMTRRHGGTGLGLAICREIVQRMGGDVSLVSVLGVGTTVHARFLAERCAAPPTILPLRATHAPSEAASMADGTAGPARWSQPIAVPASDRPTTEEGPSPVARQAPQVLVVEDNPINRMVATGLLKRLGAEVTLAEGGAEAVASVQQRSFDLILMDIQMPDMDGHEATRQIRRLPHGRSVPIVALSANAYAEDLARSKAVGMDEHLAKPVSAAALQGALERWVYARPTPAQPRPAPTAPVAHRDRARNAEPV
jgi:signal transduction histidine kinase/ActR/RegA family two-component response regulator